MNSRVAKARKGDGCGLFEVAVLAFARRDWGDIEYVISQNGRSLGLSEYEFSEGRFNVILLLVPSN